MHRIVISVVCILSVFLFSNTFGKEFDRDKICKSGVYPNNPLNILYEQAIADSFVNYPPGTQIPRRFEASDVVLRGDGQVMYVVFDNSFQIGALCTSSIGCKDEMLTWPDDSVRDLESQFEGITYNFLQDTYFVAQEAIPSLTDKKKFQPNIFEIRIRKNSSLSNIQILESCRVDMQFESDSKGFEGLEYVVHEKSGKVYLLALCEANKCASSITDEVLTSNSGHGRLAVLEKRERTKKDPCQWKIAGMIDLPKTVNFVDYSAVSIYRETASVLPSYIAVTSQEKSQMWIGRIDEINASPFFQVSAIPRDRIYNLPRVFPDANQCLIQYCNVEGVAWIDQRQLLLVSDKSKKEQDELCATKDQRVHYVQLPERLTPI